MQGIGGECVSSGQTGNRSGLAEMSFYPEIRRSSRGNRLDVAGAHPGLELDLVISGKATCFFSDRQQDLVPGTLLWIAPGEYHHLLRSPDFEMWLAVIDPQDFAPQLLADVVANPCRLLSSEDALTLDRLFSHLTQDSDKPEVYRAGADYLFRSAWHATLSSPGPQRRSLHPAVVQALDLLRSDKETPTSATIARRCGMTQGYLGGLLIEQTGRGFVEWRNRFRIERFLTNYPKTHDLVTAAFDAGFGSYTQFHRVFHDLVGSTPGEWAKSGTDTSLGPTVSVANIVRGTPGSSHGMIWYPLSELVFPAVARWFKPAFSSALLSNRVEGGKAKVVASKIESWGELRPFEATLLDDIKDFDTAQIERLREAFARMDLFDMFRGQQRRYGSGCEDLADLVAIYIGTAWFCATNAPLPSKLEATVFINRVRAALNASTCFADASDDDRRIAAAGLIATSTIMYHAIVAARSSGNEQIVARMATVALASCLSTTGVDLKSMSLFGATS